MRVLLDANLFLSFLLHPDRESAASGLVRAALAGHFVLLVPEGLLAEIETQGKEKPYLAARIAPAALRELLDLVADAAELIPPIPEPLPALTRDPKDDYLVAYAVVGRADYLVTGDLDLLTLGEVEGVQIVTPRDFVDRMSRDPG